MHDANIEKQHLTPEGMGLRISMLPKEAYKILGIPTYATPTIIESAYKERIKQWNLSRQEKNPRALNAAIARFEQAQEAYDHIQTYLRELSTQHPFLAATRQVQRRSLEDTIDTYINDARKYLQERKPNTAFAIYDEAKEFFGTAPLPHIDKRLHELQLLVSQGYAHEITTLLQEGDPYTAKKLYANAYAFVRENKNTNTRAHLVQIQLTLLDHHLRRIEKSARVRGLARQECKLALEFIAAVPLEEHPDIQKRKESIEEQSSRILKLQPE